MAFGAPRPVVTIINIAFVVGGFVVLICCSGWIRWIGLPLLIWGLLAGLIMGSWAQLFPGSRPSGRRDGTPAGHASNEEE